MITRDLVASFLCSRQSVVTIQNKSFKERRRIKKEINMFELRYQILLGHRGSLRTASVASVVVVAAVQDCRFP